MLSLTRRVEAGSRFNLRWYESFNLRRFDLKLRDDLLRDQDRDSLSAPHSGRRHTPKHDEPAQKMVAFTTRAHF